jgi:hypothetical protein
MGMSDPLFKRMSLPCPDTGCSNAARFVGGIYCKNCEMQCSYQPDGRIGLVRMNSGTIGCYLNVI